MWPDPQETEEILNPIQNGPFRGCSRMGGKQGPPL